MSYIVLVDARRVGGGILTIEDEGGSVMEFASEEEARDAMRGHVLEATCRFMVIDFDNGVIEYYA